MAHTNIKDMIPHREPFLYVDKIDEADEKRIVGTRRFTDKEYFFAGHFPGLPIVPGVILVESMAQCGGAGVVAAGLMKDKLFFLASIEKVKFRNQVVPNDEVRYEIENIQVSARGIRQSGKGYVGDKLAVEAVWLCLLGDKEK